MRKREVRGSGGNDKVKKRQEERRGIIAGERRWTKEVTAW